MYTQATHQTFRYVNFYRGSHFRFLFRFDVRYRCRRIHEVLAQLGICVENRKVMDFGFGNGALLKTFPKTCALVGVDVSASAVDGAYADSAYEAYRSAMFFQVDEHNPSYCTGEQFDLVLSSHTLEHTIDDDAVLRSFYERTKPGGHLCLFVPIEEPDYIRFHCRTYSLPSIQAACQKAGYDIVYAEPSMHINGHIWKLLTIPSRREWPVFGKLADALRLTTLSLMPYDIIKAADCILDKLSFSPRQAFVVAKKKAL